MRAAEDAVVLDTTGLDAEGAFQEAWVMVQGRLAG
jgi:cytidylate kinase